LPTTSKSGIINIRGDIISSPIEARHPADIVSALGNKGLDRRQQDLLDKLPGYGSQAIVNKRDVSMLDLASLTAATGDEFAMFTRKRERLIVRGNAKRVPIDDKAAIRLHNEGYRWSGHTHPGYNDSSLVISDGDRTILKCFKQDKSVVYNSAGKRALVTLKEE